MSQVTAEKLPQEYLTIIEEVCAEMSEKSIPNTETEVNEGIETLKEMGVEILPITDEERAQIGAQVLEKITPDLESYFGKELLDKAYEDIENASK